MHSILISNHYHLSANNIAREYGLPCVSGLENATMNIPDGAMIEVDGSNGIVRVLEAV